MVVDVVIGPAPMHVPAVALKPLPDPPCSCFYRARDCNTRLLGVVYSQATRKEMQVPTRSYAGKVNAPEFPAGLDWLNSGRPVTLGELRGKLVILDFWTYC